VVRDFGLYFGAWLLGFAHHDGLLRRLPRRHLMVIAVTLGGLGAAWIFTHPGPRGYDLNDIHLGNALWSAGFTLLLLGLAPASALWVDRAALLSRAVTVLNRRALTIYLWHMPIVIGVNAVAVAAGLGRDSVAGLTVRLVVVAALVVLAVALFGWVEDVAARRRPTLLPAGPAPARVPRQVGPSGAADDIRTRGANAPVRGPLVRVGSG
jgi:peptidoglycan/LPS O-acetylase OafA/YrhL